MDFQLAGRTALVTGASQGIGKAIARLRAKEGVRVAMAARHVELLQAYAQALVSEGCPKPEIIQADLDPANASEELAAKATRALGHIDPAALAGGPPLAGRTTLCLVTSAFENPHDALNS